jgi:hypothetical protein
MHPPKERPLEVRDTRQESHTVDEEPFWEQALLNAIGPLVAVIVGGVVIAGVASLLQKRREQRQIDRELTVDMFRIAYGFYRLVEDARRRSQYGEGEPQVEVLDHAYSEFAVASRTAEARLRVVPQEGSSATARWLWHSIADLLTVLYFHIRHSDRRLEDLITNQQREHEETAGRDATSWDVIHRFLDPKGLRDVDAVKGRFAEAMDELVALRR